MSMPNKKAPMLSQGGFITKLSILFILRLPDPLSKITERGFFAVHQNTNTVNFCTNPHHTKETGDQ